MNNYEIIKDKEQMARIIAFDLCKQSYHSNWYGNEAQCYSDNNFHDCKKIKVVVDKLYNANYRQVPKDAVVLTQEEYEELKNESAAIVKDYQEMGQFYDEKCEELEKLIQEKHKWTEQASKETAKEFAEKLKAYIDNNKHQSHFFGTMCLIDKETVNEIAKQFGVEVAE